MDTPLSISAVFPCYNDSGTIGGIVVKALNTLELLADDFEVVVVDDGSSDGSQEILQRLADGDQRVRVIYHKKNQGYGGALRSGFQNARLDWIFYTDGDAQYDVSELQLLVENLSGNVDIIQGYKRKRHDPLHRRIIGTVYKHSMRFLFALPIRDVACDFRLFRRQLVDAQALEHKSGVICVELIKKLQLNGARFIEVPVSHFERPCGKSQFFSFQRVARTIRGVIQLWFQLMPRCLFSRQTAKPEARTA